MEGTLELIVADLWVIMNQLTVNYQFLLTNLRGFLTPSLTRERDHEHVTISCLYHGVLHDGT